MSYISEIVFLSSDSGIWCFLSMSSDESDDMTWDRTLLKGSFVIKYCMCS